MSLHVADYPGRTLPPLATAADWTALTGETPPAGAARELTAASAAVRRYCRWHISPVVDDVVTLNGRGGHTLVLPTMRLLTVVSISETQRGRTATPEAVDLTTVEATEQGWLFRDTLWTHRLSGVSVEMAHGYEPEEVPDLAAAVALMAVRGLTNPTGIDMAMVGTVQVRYARQTDGVYTVVGGFDEYARRI